MRTVYWKEAALKASVSTQVVNYPSLPISPQISNAMFHFVGRNAELMGAIILKSSVP